MWIVNFTGFKENYNQFFVSAAWGVILAVYAFTLPGGGFCQGYGAVTGAACHVQDLLLGAVHNLLEGLLPPDIVNTQGHKVVKAVVGRSDVIEHLLYFLFLWHN